jgi:hypothetical protein
MGEFDDTIWMSKLPMVALSTPTALKLSLSGGSLTLRDELKGEALLLIFQALLEVPKVRVAFDASFDYAAFLAEAAVAGPGADFGVFKDRFLKLLKGG